MIIEVVYNQGGIALFYAWDGRVDEGSKSKRIHQVVENVHVNDVRQSEANHLGIVGFASDEGVKRNKGRTGAAEAPNEIRKWMASIPYHYEKKRVIDLGNVSCSDQDLEGAQNQLAEHVTTLIHNHYTPIILGGGHETFYGHYLGARNAVGTDKKIGIINLDAHFDLRQDEPPTSGTMFRQALESDGNVDYLCVGIQELGNAKQLFETAEKHGVTYILAKDLHPLEQTFEVIDAFAKKQDYVIYTICTDVINQAYAPGVSAPAPFGIEPTTVRRITERIVLQPNFLSFDVSEVNPSLDVAHQTARLMAYVVSEIMLLINKDK